MKAIFLDGFKIDYLQHAPYLREQTTKHQHGELEVPFGYTSIIASFVTGNHPDKHGVIDVFEKRTTPGFTIHNKHLAILTRLLTKNHYFYSPLQTNKANYFKTSMKKIWMQKGCLPQPTIFDILEHNGKTFEAIDWPVHYQGRNMSLFFKNDAATIMNKARKAQADFILIHFADLDELGHKYGPESQEIINKIQEIDNYCKELDEPDMIFFSDHGMDPITEHYNLEEELNKLGLTYGKDWEYFIASTYARFWYHNEEAKEKTEILLKTLTQGKIINAKDYHLPPTQDTIYLANKGIVFSPSFFTPTIDYKAMHGWDPKEQKAFYLIKKLPAKKEETHMINLMPTILDLMNLPYSPCDGKSLFK
ncbi:MAG TPA: alkaline phosphatase family protein [Candidatus Nanoarchaeia archaeon]|nr:alkaline phosphatase family protein [Candidatus Nanoarchaeia archaeon]